MLSSHYNEDETPMSLYARVKRAEAHAAREIFPTFWNYFQMKVFGTIFHLFIFFVFI